jgi:hypothetical protein
MPITLHNKKKKKIFKIKKILHMKVKFNKSCNFPLFTVLDTLKRKFAYFKSNFTRQTLPYDLDSGMD